MNESNARPRQLRFGVFEVDLRTGELRKQGLKVKLHGQPFQVLAMLLERPGELVSREEIREKLWPGDTFIDFEQSVNTSIKRLREALGDAAEHPRYIETLPRHGYRFVCPVETVRRAVSKEETLQRRVSTSAPEAVATGEAQQLLTPASESRGMETSPASESAGGGQGEVEAVQAGAELALRATAQQAESVREAVGSAVGAAREPPRRKRRTIAAMVGVPVTLLVALFVLNVAGLRERVLRAVRAAREPPLQIQSIAVLPLENLSRDPEQEYFARRHDRGVDHQPGQNQRTAGHLTDLGDAVQGDQEAAAPDCARIERGRYR